MKAKTCILASLLIVEVMAGCRAPLHNHPAWDYTVRDYGALDTGAINRSLAELTADGWIVDRVFAYRPSQAPVFILRRERSTAARHSDWEYTLRDYRGFGEARQISGDLGELGQKGWVVIDVASGGGEQLPFVVLRRRRE